MTKFVTRIATAAAIALAAVPVIAVGAANAQERTVAISVADLDFSKAADVARFDARVDSVASKLCVSRSLRTAAACEQDVKAQASERLGARQQARMAASTAPAPILVAAR